MYSSSDCIDRNHLTECSVCLCFLLFYQFNADTFMCCHGINSLELHHYHRDSDGRFAPSLVRPWSFRPLASRPK